MQSAIARPLAFGTGVVCLATLLAYVGRWSWFCELLVNFRTHFALLLAVALVVAALVRRWGIAVVAVSGLLLNIWPMYGMFVTTGMPPAADARAVRVVAFNANIRNDKLPAVAAYLESLEADIAVLEEVSPANAERLASLLPRMPHRYLDFNEDIWGVVIFSRWPLRAPQPVVRDGVELAARTDVDFGDRRLRLYGVHLNWPLVPAAAEGRNAQLAALARELAQCPGACLVVGDFNTTPWSSHFRDLLQTSGFRDCAAGQGWLPTWHSQLPVPLRIRIDHCLAGPGMAVEAVRVGDSVGSDHLATINDLLILHGGASPASPAPAVRPAG